jgi:ankyrin repeat protein
MFDDRDKRERSPIYLASMGNHLQALEVLLQHARDTGEPEKEKLAINEIDRYSRTGLHAAAELGHVEIVRELLRRQASLTMKDDDEHTALMLCCKKNRLDVLKVFIEFINGQYQTTREKLSIYEQRDDGSNTGKSGEKLLHIINSISLSASYCCFGRSFGYYSTSTSTRM